MAALMPWRFLREMARMNRLFYRMPQQWLWSAEDEAVGYVAN